MNIIKNKFLFIITLAMMSMIGLISSDIYLPSMPYIAGYFNVNHSMVQNTITIYLIGLAFFQLIYGPISDVFGRKKTLIIGLLIYIISSIVCMLSPSILVLFVARFFQAIGACSGLVMGRSIIADIFDKKQSAHVFSIILPIVAMSPAISPVIGGHLQDWIGWHASFGFSVVFGIVLLYLVIWHLDESLKSFSHNKFNPMMIINRNLTLFKSVEFVFYTLIVGIIYCSWFSYLTASSYIYTSFGLNASLIGYCYISQSLASVAGSITSKRAIKRISINMMILLAFFIGLFGAMFIHLCGSELFEFLIGITIMAFANGILLPLNISQAMSAAVEYNPGISGTASGLLGFFQIGFGAFGAFFISLIRPDISSLSWFLTMCILIGIIMISVPIRRSLTPDFSK
jgi:DHA1 family bicyclomycin/chloramphenicol resistance-like MFS transporter